MGKEKLWYASLPDWNFLNEYSKILAHSAKQAAEKFAKEELIDEDCRVVVFDENRENPRWFDVSCVVDLSFTAMENT